MGARAWATRWAGSWAAYVRWEDGKRIGRPVGLAGWLARAEQAEAVCEAYILSSFSIFFIISSLLFEFKFGSKI